jgi:hypothetical protein
MKLQGLHIPQDAHQRCIKRRDKSQDQLQRSRPDWRRIVLEHLRNQTHTIFALLLGSKKLGNAGVIVNEQITTLVCHRGKYGHSHTCAIDEPKNKRNKRKKKRLNTAIVEFRACNFLKRAPSIHRRMTMLNSCDC